MGYDGVEEAFDLLLSELESALRSEDRAGSDAFARGDHEGVRAALARAERIKRVVQAVQDLRRQWSGGERGEVGTPRRARKRTGAVTHQREYRIPILRALVNVGGSASTSEVLEHIAPVVEPFLTEADRSLLGDGRTVRWCNAAQWERKRMVLAGLLRRDSPRGIWEITEEGRRYLEDHEGKGE